jgi:hypothetical protein
VVLVVLIHNDPIVMHLWALDCGALALLSNVFHTIRRKRVKMDDRKEEGESGTSQESRWITDMREIENFEILDQTDILTSLIATRERGFRMRRSCVCMEKEW